MKLKHVFIVFKKEVKDIIRDRRTIITSFVAPLVLMPVLLLITGGSVQKFEKELRENVRVALASNSNTGDIKRVAGEIVAVNPDIELVDTEDPIGALKNGDVRAVLEIDPDYKDKLSQYKPFTINIYYKRGEAESESSLNILKAAISQYNSKVVVERIKALGQSVDILEPVRINEINEADEKKSSNMMVLMMLPMLMAILVVVGGIPAATDLVAGEKERNTFEPLLTTAPSRLSILLGKYLAVTLFSLFSVLATVSGYFIGYTINPNFINMGIEGDTGLLNVPAGTLVLAILISIELGMTFAGIQIALSTFAKSFKEAQTYLSFLIFVGMIPGYATMFMQPTDVKLYMMFTPILNTVAAFKLVLGGVINYTYLVLALATSLIYVVLALLLAAWTFNNEKYLFRN